MEGVTRTDRLSKQQEQQQGRQRDLQPGQERPAWSNQRDLQQAQRAWLHLRTDHLAGQLQVWSFLLQVRRRRREIWREWLGSSGREVSG